MCIFSSLDATNPQTPISLMLTLARKWLNANISCCLTVSNGLSNMLFHLCSMARCPSGFSRSIVFAVAVQSGSGEMIMICQIPYLEHSSTTLSFRQQRLSFPPWVWRQRKMAAVWIWWMDANNVMLVVKRVAIYILYGYTSSSPC